MNHRKFNKFNRFTSAFYLVLALLPEHVLAEQYVCVADKSSGFRYDPSITRWVSASFKTEAKFVISEQPKQIAKGGKFVYEGTYFVVKEMNASLPSMYVCDKNFDDYGRLSCEMPILGGSFKFNRRNGRYLRESSGGYVDVLPGGSRLTDDKSDTPFMEIGMCTAFSP